MIKTSHLNDNIDDRGSIFELDHLLPDTNAETRDITKFLKTPNGSSQVKLQSLKSKSTTPGLPYQPKYNVTGQKVK